MEDTVYLVMDIGGVRRMAKKPPKLAGNERSVAIEINVADEIFEYTFMKSTLTVTEDDVMEPSMEIQLLHNIDKL